MIKQSSRVARDLPEYLPAPGCGELVARYFDGDYAQYQYVLRSGHYDIELNLPVGTLTTYHT